ncbi:hypothetical protein H4R19_000703 [Coemansia spiralis]|nr:hypothetical protein H4R19_000703 [Coemansia spiralis]
MSYVSPLTAFASTVPSQTHEIHELSRVSGFFTVAHFFYYENTAGAADFMSTRLLEEAFVQVLHEYPLLAGTLDESRTSRHKVTIDRDNLNLPEFKETQCDIDFAQLKAAHYAPSALPEGAATDGRYTDHTRKKPAKLTRVHIIRCKDNSGVAMFIAISHVLVDGTAFNQVMRRWAELCKHLAADGAADAKPGRPLTFGCDMLDGYIRQVAPPAGAFIHHQFMPSGLMSKLVGMCSMTTQVKLLRKLSGPIDLTSHFYFVAQETMDALRHQIRESVPDDQAVSNNDVLTALINVAMAQSLPSDAPAGVLQRAMAAVSKLFSSPPPAEFVHLGVANLRPRLKIPSAADYCGSAVLLYAASVPLAALQAPVTSKTLALAATAARKGTESVDRGYIHAYSTSIAAAPDTCMRPFVYGGAPPGFLVITNHARIGHYECDFGWGGPTWANVIEDTMSTLCYVYPSHPSRNGSVVHLMLPRDIQDRLRQLQFWNDNTEFIR